MTIPYYHTYCALRAPPLIDNYKHLRLAPNINIGTLWYVTTIHASFLRVIFFSYSSYLVVYLQLLLSVYCADRKEK